MDHGIVGMMAVMTWADAKWRLKRMDVLASRARDCWLAGVMVGVLFVVRRRLS
jgi:hypothetical protein